MCPALARHLTALGLRPHFVLEQAVEQGTPHTMKPIEAFRRSTQHVRRLFADPQHPYTRGLIGAVPVPGEILDELATIPGSVPNLIELPDGCRFSPRCATREEHGNVLADRLHPELRAVDQDHLVRCWLYHHEDGSARPDPDSWQKPLHNWV